MSETPKDRYAEAVREALDLAPGSDRSKALAAGVSAALLSQVRGGNSRPSEETVQRLADVLGRQAKEHLTKARRSEEAESKLRRVLAEVKAERDTVLVKGEKDA